MLGFENIAAKTSIEAMKSHPLFITALLILILSAVHASGMTGQTTEIGCLARIRT
jgi:hypothetical protein